MACRKSELISCGLSMRWENNHHLCVSSPVALQDQAMMGGVKNVKTFMIWHPKLHSFFYQNDAPFLTEPAGSWLLDFLTNGRHDLDKIHPSILLSKVVEAGGKLHPKCRHYCPIRGGLSSSLNEDHDRRIFPNLYVFGWVTPSWHSFPIIIS